MFAKELFQIFSAFFVGFFVVWYTIPVIVRMSIAKNLHDVPDHRKVNTKVIPNMGGISIFLGISLGTMLSLTIGEFPEFRFIFSGMMIMFFIGLKDDMIIISPLKKLVAQIICAMVIVLLGDIRITHLHGILGINEINYYVSIFLSILGIVGTINAMNLIDGIDGLAASIGILSSLIFGILFFQTGHIAYASICFATLGSLITFFAYNVFGHANKIFMGDTGALILGLILSAFAIHFNESFIAGNEDLVRTAPILSLAILAVPLFDMVRLFSLRIYNGKSPFSPDMNHIHHKFLQLGFSHLKSTSIIALANLFIISVIYALKALDNSILLTILLIWVSALMILPGRIYEYQQSKKEGKKKKVKLYTLRAKGINPVPFKVTYNYKEALTEDDLDFNKAANE